MRYTIVHSTLYRYSHPVHLGTHCVKLCPRSDGAQQLHRFELAVEPEPRQQTVLLDPEGNRCQRLWFEPTSVTQLKVVTTTEVETYRTNPFDYLTAPWAIALPWDYPSTLALRLSPYLARTNSAILHPSVIEFAHEILHQVNGNAGLFVSQLTQAIYDRCQYIQRLDGDPYPAGITLTHQEGTCRDFAVLWIDACRAVGLAARFVSGYQQGDSKPDLEQASVAPSQHDLHAWAEVYMPGGGWRGFDPTLGLAVADGHVAIAAAADPRHAAPVRGQIQAVDHHPKTTLDCHIMLKVE